MDCRGSQAVLLSFCRVQSDFKRSQVVSGEFRGSQERFKEFLEVLKRLQMV